MRELNKSNSYIIYKKTVFYSILLLCFVGAAIVFSSPALSHPSLVVVLALVVSSALVLALNVVSMPHRAFWQITFCSVCLLCVNSVASHQPLWTVLALYALAGLLFTLLVSRWQKDFHLIARQLLQIKLSYKTLVLDLLGLGVFANAVFYAVYALVVYALPLLVKNNYNSVRSTIFYMLTIFSAIASIHYSFIQPADKFTMSKVKYFDIGNELARDSLENKLVKRYKRKYGVQIIAFLLRPFLSVKVKGKKNVDTDTFPCIFICNHYELYGPMASVIYLPFQYRPWANIEVLDKQLTYDHVYQNSLKQKKMPDFLKRMLANVCKTLGTWALNSFDCIPVFKGNVKDVVKTITGSIEALKQGDNLLIFPENPKKTEDGRYQKDGISPLYSGFAHLGKAYFAATGKRLPFYPVFLDKTSREMRIGHAITFDPANAPAEEKQRIANEITDALNDLRENKAEVN